MRVYSSQYLHIEFFPEQELIEMTWLPATKGMTEEEYKEQGFAFLEQMTALQPKKIISDSSELYFTITPDLQDWTNQTILPIGIAGGLNKIAHVVSKDIFAQVSVEQLMEEVAQTDFSARYFGDKESAKEWLQSF